MERKNFDKPNTWFIEVFLFIVATDYRSAEKSKLSQFQISNV